MLFFFFPFSNGSLFRFIPHTPPFYFLQELLLLCVGFSFLSFSFPSAHGIWLVFDDSVSLDSIFSSGALVILAALS